MTFPLLSLASDCLRMWSSAADALTRRPCPDLVVSPPCRYRQPNDCLEATVTLTFGTLARAGLVAALGAVVLLPAGAGAQSTPRCRAGDLAGAIIDTQGGAGSRDARLILVNTSTHTCHIKGFIGAQLIDTSNHPLATHVQRSGATPHAIVVKPGAAGAVALHWNVIPSGSTPCRLARWLQVTPPDGTSTVRVYFHDTACRGELGVGPVTDPRTV